MWEIDVDRRTEESFIVGGFLLLGQEAEDASTVIVEDDDVDVDWLKFWYEQSVHIMVKGDIADD